VQPTSRRERKKLETHRALIHAATDLVTEHGLDGVTVEQIADAAGFTARTFFNYFSCKEEAVVAYDPVTLAGLAAEVRERPVTEAPGRSLLAVLVTGDRSNAIVDRWQQRQALVSQHPRLLPHYLAAMQGVEAEISAALAQRAGVDPDEDPRLRMFVAGALASARVGVSWWSTSDRSRPLTSVLEEAFDLMAPSHPHTS
jgi:AcrR family transcriptional regulator